MHIKQVLLSNFHRYRGALHNVAAGPGVIAVVAEDEQGDAARSNGSGKSGLLHAIRFAFFGHPRPRELVTWGEEEMRVELHLSTGHVVSRGYRGGASYVEVTGTDGAVAADAEALLAELLGMDAAAYDATCSLLEGDVGRLAAAGQAERRDLLAAWVVPEAWAAAGERSKALLRAAERERDGLRARLQAAAGSQDPAALAADLDRTRAELAELPEPPDPVAVRAASDRRAVRARWERDREDAEELRRELRMLPPAPEAPDPSLAAKLRDQLARARPRLAELDRLSRGQFDGPCPVDGVPCPRAAEIREAAAGHRAKLAEARSWVDERAVRLRTLEAAEDAQARAQRARERVEAQLAQALARLDPEPPPPSVADLELLGAAPPDLEIRRALAQRVGHLEAEHARAVADAAARAELEAALAAADRRVAELAWAATACGRGGVPAMLVDYAAGAVAADASAILEAAGSPLRLGVRLSRELSRPAERCGCGATFLPKTKKCGACGAARGPASEPDLAFEAWREDDERRADFSRRSSGERGILAVALRLAAAGHRKRASGSPLALLVLDEADANLDAEHAAVLAQMARSCAAVIGVEQTWVASHRAESRLAADQVVRVVRGPEGSWIG